MEYKDCEYNIRIFKHKDMENSRQIIQADDRLGLLAGICSFLQSCLDNKVITEEELSTMVDMVFERRKNGEKNEVIYNNIKEGE